MLLGMASAAVEPVMAGDVIDNVQTVSVWNNSHNKDPSRCVQEGLREEKQKGGNPGKDACIYRLPTAPESFR
jgi:hypothetical protein